ncbi:MAG: hypothetical protein ACLKAN_12960, partial [Alkaliphilus sp.]
SRIVGKLPPKIFDYRFYRVNCAAESNSIAFVMNPYMARCYVNKFIIPIFIDVWHRDLEILRNITKELNLFFVISYDIYASLKRMEPKSNVQYLPLSIADKWVSGIQKKIGKKSIDVIQYGRRSEVLHKHMLMYVDKYKTVEYIYQTPKGKQLFYYSTTRGELDEIDTRGKFMSLLEKCRVSLVSATGYDGSRDTDKTFTVPARFYEGVVNYCYMIGRYPENFDFNILNISSVCDNVKSYEQFERLMDKYLNGESFLKETEYKHFIEDNVTSKRVQTVLSHLEKHSSDRDRKHFKCDLNAR